MAQMKANALNAFFGRKIKQLAEEERIIGRPAASAD
jgi:hypothetical protein